MKVKICLIGEAAVGKTSLIRRYVHNDFDDKYITTLGAKVSKKEIGFDLEQQELHVDMDMTIWDIMGEKGFRDLVKEAFFIGTRGILAVCDLTRYDTLKELDDWVQSVFKVVGSIPVVFAVNKVDLKDEVLLMYGETELDQAARAFDAQYLYTSAKTGENVENSFRKLGQMIIDSSVSPRLAK
ncbi:MAG: GTP-binding protein [Methanomassiliicoccales archaeon]|nr:MAG: GTP-binding protein [Methanomassiliicoccales archaeon]